MVVNLDQRILFRVDGSPEIGLGHLQRCLSLGAALTLQGARSHFMIRRNETARRRISDAGFEAIEIPLKTTLETDLHSTLKCLRQQGAQVVVVDCREIDHDYLLELRRAGYFIVSIDDLAEMIFPSHIVVNGNVYAEDLSYRSSSGDTCFLLGTDYVLLRQEFWSVPDRLTRDNVSRLLLTLGGMDKNNLMPRLLDLLEDIPGDFDITAIIGPFFENHRELEHTSRRSRRSVNLVDAPSVIRDLMLEADLAISGGGQTLYELARTGCPTVTVQVASDQNKHLQALSEAGVIYVGTWQNTSDLAEMRSAIMSLLLDRETRASLSITGQRLVDGQGAMRVAQGILAGVGSMQY